MEFSLLCRLIIQQEQQCWRWWQCHQCWRDSVVLQCNRITPQETTAFSSGCCCSECFLSFTAAAAVNWVIVFRWINFKFSWARLKKGERESHSVWHITCTTFFTLLYCLFLLLSYRMTVCVCANVSKKDAASITDRHEQANRQALMLCNAVQYYHRQQFDLVIDRWQPLPDTFSSFYLVSITNTKLFWLWLLYNNNNNNSSI